VTKNRRSIRLQGYDYSQAGAYFVTICTQNKECLFGEIENGKMRLNDAGKMARKYWDDIPAHFPNVTPDVFVVMPNHIHGILFIADAPVGAKNVSPIQPHKRPHGTSKTIGSVIRGFKIGVTKWMRQSHGRNIFRPNNLHVVWQRNYYEHIISNNDEMNRISEYVINNPVQWDMDWENPTASMTGQIDVEGDA